MCLVTEKNIIVSKKGTETTFSLAEVVKTKVKHKVLLLHAIAGGIIMPLCLIATFNHLGDIWVMMSCAFGGLLLLYYGLAGKDTFTVYTPLKEYDFFIDSSYPGLLHFSTFLNEIILSENGYKHYFCLLLTDQEWNRARDTGFISVPKEGRPLQGINTIVVEEGYVGFILDSPFENALNIQFVSGEDRVMTPRIFTDIPIKMLKKMAQGQI